MPHTRATILPVQIATIMCVGVKRRRRHRIGVRLFIAGVLLLAVTLAVRAWGAPDAEFNRVVGWANIGSFVLAAVGLAMAFWESKQPDAAPAQTADFLAAAGLKSEGHALRELLFAGREPGHRANLTFQSQGLVQFSSASSRGDLESVADYYANATPGRMVVLGEPGAGKTVLALALICRLLEHRKTLAERTRSSTPVPVRFDLTGWDTGGGLEDWLAQALADRFAGLSPESARALIHANLVLPVLDGLDEMDLPDSEPTRGRAAITQLNRYLAGSQLLPVVVTCRQQEYDQLGDELAGAVEVIINPLNPEQIHTYMNHELASRSDQDVRVSWDSLSQHDEVLGLLATPWLLTMLAVYLRDGGPAADLTPQGAEQHDAFRRRVWEVMLDKYIPARTRSSDDTRYSPEQVIRWSTSLAVNLGDEVDILLTDTWRVGGRGRVRAAHAVASVFVPVALIVIGVLALNGWDYQHVIDQVRYSVEHLDTGPSRWFNAVTAIYLFAVGPLLGTLTVDNIGPSPSRPMVLGHLRTREGRRQLAAGIRGGLRRGRPLVLVAVVAVGVAVFGVARTPSAGEIALMLVLGIAFALAPAFAFGLMGGLAPRDPSMTGPTNTVYSDLASLLAIGLSGGIGGGLVAGLAGKPPVAGIAFGLAGGLGVGLTLGFGAIWMRYMCGLGVAGFGGALPVRLVKYLRWAHQAGILRRSGPAYQFRHITLRDHLQAQHQDTPDGLGLGLPE